MVSRARSAASASWVVLHDSLLGLAVNDIRNALDQAFPHAFLPQNDGSFVLDGPEPCQFFIKSVIDGASGLFVLHDVPASYEDFSALPESIGDPALREIALAQTCWLSVDLIGAIGSTSDAYRFIGGVLARLAPSTAAVLVHPDFAIAFPFDDRVRSRLSLGLEPSICE